MMNITQPINKYRTVTDYTELEYKQFAANKNFQSIASLISGVKPTSNKVLYTVFDDNVTSWSKVEDISSATSLKTKYLGGATNIDGVIVNMSKTYVSSNNVSVLDTKGDFGARLNSASAASRYIFIRKGKLFDVLFNKNDLAILPQYSFEGHMIEYRFFLFSLPMLLINGSEGMGSGHAQNILGRNPLDIKKSLLSHLKDGASINTPPPWFRGFTGSVTKGENEGQWIISGELKKINSTTTQIIEIPIDVSKKAYIKKLEAMLEKKEIADYTDLCDPKNDKILFEIKHSREFGSKSESEMKDIFKLYSKITENYTCIDENNSIKRCKSADEIFNHYIKVKLEYLALRKDSMLSIIKDDIFEIKSKILFIDGIVNDKIIVNKQSKEKIVAQLKEIAEIITIDESYDYLLRMPIHSLTNERIKDLKAQLESKKIEYKAVKSKTVNEMWIEDLEKIPDNI